MSSLTPLLYKHSPFAALIINHAEDLCTGKNFFVSNLTGVIKKFLSSVDKLQNLTVKIFDVKYVLFSFKRTSGRLKYHVKIFSSVV